MDQCTSDVHCNVAPEVLPGGSLYSPDCTECGPGDSRSTTAAACSEDFSKVTVDSLPPLTGPIQGRECEDGSSVADSKDAHDAQVPTGKKLIGTAQTCILIIKSFLGGGILFLPYAVMKGGVLLSLCTISLTFLVALYCIRLLTQCCTPGKSESYEQLGEKAFGWTCRLAIEICVVLTQLSFATINAVVVWGNLRDVIWTISNCSPAHKWSVTSLLWLGIFYFGPVSLISNLKYLPSLMLLGNIGTAVGVLLLLIAVPLSGSGQWAESVPLASWSNWPLMIGTSIFMWEGGGLMLPIRAYVTPRVQNRFSMLVTLCLTSLLLLYIGYSILCIAVFGHKLKVVILANLTIGPLSITVQTIFALAVMATYPLLLFPASAIAEKRLLPDRAVVSPLKYTIFRSLLRIGIVLVTLVAATVGLRQLDSFVALVGSVCGAPLTFLFPAFLHVKLCKQSSPALLVLHYAMIVIGICILLFSVYWTIINWRGTEDFPAHCSGSYL